MKKSEGAENELKTHDRPSGGERSTFDFVEALLDVEILGIVVLDREGICRFFNRGAGLLTGYSRDECIGGPLPGGILDRKDEEYIKKKIEAGSAISNLEVRIKRRDESEKDVILSVSRLNAHDPVNGYVIFIVDNTEKKHLQNLLLHSQKMEIVGEMAGGIAHDFNNLLEGILGYTSFMMGLVENESELYSYLEIVFNAAKKASDLSDRLLTFSKDQDTEKTPLNINTILKEVVKLLERSIDKRVTIEMNLSKDVKEVLGASGQLEQALLNVCLNARDAMPNGGKLMMSSENVFIDRSYPRLSWKMSIGEYVKISIADTGIGMNKETMTKIFEPFFTTKKRSEGTGLGLSMVYGIVDKHGGFINVYSEVGEGTVFNIYLPASGGPAPEEKVAEKREDIPLGKNEKVLFIDDEPVVRDLGRDMLVKLGYNVLTAGGADEGMKLFKENIDKLDLVILDIIMPGASGQDLFREMTRLNPKVKVILSSGYNRGFLEEDLANEEGVHFIQKPYAMEELARQVRKILDSDRS